MYTLHGTCESIESNFCAKIILHYYYLYDTYNTVFVKYVLYMYIGINGNDNIRKYQTDETSTSSRQVCNLLHF